MKSNGEIVFFVPGVPVPKGSARAFFNKKIGRALVVQTNAEKQKPWASMVSLKAQMAGLTPETQACQVSLLFILPRPKRHLRTNGELKPAARAARHKTKPDLDKLIRCVLDALTGVAYVDDSQVDHIDTDKIYSDRPVVGCEIKVRYLDEEG